MVVVSIAICGVLALLFGLFEISSGYLNAVLHFFEMFFLWIGIPGMISACLLALTKMDDGLVFGFGFAFYYGGGMVALAIMEYGGCPEKLSLALGYLISALICYIIYREKFAPKE